ncbi:hypothetical protein D3C83_157610 [compost metagenome]
MHPEAMLLVDDDEAEAQEFHVLGQQLVRADDDVDLAARQFPDDFGGLLGAAKPR